MIQKPLLSAILISFDGSYQIVERTIKHLARQTVVDQIELVLVTPAGQNTLTEEDALTSFHSCQLVGMEVVRTVAAGYCQGIRAAKADIVVLCEDHCFPAPDWAAHLLAAHRENWAAVGPAVRNANPGNRMSWASLLLDYSEWLEPVDSGVKSHIPGHNSSYKKAVLLEYGPELEMMLEAESILHWDLQKRGREVYLESRAKTHHLNFEIFSSCAPVLYFSGRRFAACRMRWDDWSKRMMFILGSPLIPFIVLNRIVRKMKRVKEIPGNPLLLLPVIFAGLCIRSAGEFMGYAFGFGNALTKATPYEFNRRRFLKKKPAGGAPHVTSGISH